MQRLQRTVLAILLACCAALPAFAQQDEAAVATATALLDRLDAGRFDAATADFSAQMKAALDAGKLAAVQRQLDAAGAVQSRGEPQVSRRDGFTVVVVRIQRAAAAIDATVAIDSDGKVAGLHFAPAAGTPK
ncbi:MAG: DUF3887 domain-containing protein [Luteimonas sp.]|nr:DUF3887 domain-containing protein [Luteimonas sp.]